MIVSVSRRTDIPAFYAEWFMNRIRAGYALSVNPFNRKQVSFVSLHPEDVSAIVFWTKNAQPMLANLAELSERGYAYYFLYTINGYPAALEPYVPPAQTGVATVQAIASQIGRDRIIWRYDPIIISNLTPVEYHVENFTKLVEQLQPYVHHVVVSFVDEYRKAKQHLRTLREQGVELAAEGVELEIRQKQLMTDLSSIAAQYELEVVTCAEPWDFSEQGVKPGKCIDENYLAEVFGQQVSGKKDAGQRLECGCVPAKDIGAYDSCIYGCTYCYAGTYDKAVRNLGKHNPQGLTLF